MRKIPSAALAGIAAFAVFQLAAPRPAAAAGYTVTRTDDPPPDGCKPNDCSLREAVRAANSTLTTFDEITLPSGTYTLTRPGIDENDAFTGDLDVWSDVWIKGANRATTVIDGGGIDRVFDVRSHNLHMSQVTVRGGRAQGVDLSYKEAGGGINVFVYGSLWLVAVDVTSNTAFQGGGIFNRGVVDIQGGTISSNTATRLGGGLANLKTANLKTTTVGSNVTWGYGAGIANGARHQWSHPNFAPACVHGTASTLDFEDGAVTGNTAHGWYIEKGGEYLHSYGGGVYTCGDEATAVVDLSGSIVDHNEADDGGGIFTADSTITRVVGSTVHHNMADRNVHGSGAGISSFGYVEITDSVVYTNTNAHNGGGVFAFGSMVMTRTTVNNNEADHSGGGLFLSSVSNVTQSSIYVNTAGTEAGGIYHNSTLVLDNSTVSLNASAYGAGGVVTGIGTFKARNATISHNSTYELVVTPFSSSEIVNSIVADSSGPLCGMWGATTSLGGNLSSDATCEFTAPGDLSGVDPLLGVIQGNGGPTKTRALGAGSPAIDAGDDARCLATDQRGYFRPADGDGDGTARCDIGAVESGGSMARMTALRPD